MSGISRFIALRYLTARTGLSIISIMTFICMVVVAVVSMAMVVVMSAFNGIEALIDDRFSYFQPDLSVEPLTSKVLIPDSINLEALRALPGVEAVSFAVEEFVLVEYERNQRIAIVKGVDEAIFLERAPIEEMVYDGEAALSFGMQPAALIGAGVKHDLNLRLFEQQFNPMRLSAIQRGKRLGANPEQAFNKRTIPVAGIFSINMDFDSDYIIVPNAFAQDLLGYKNEYSRIEIYTREGANLNALRSRIEEITGPTFETKTRFQQNELVYKTNQTEKWATFVIMGFIMLIATFNIIASLTLLINEKRRDIRVLQSMGATMGSVKSIFFTAGAMIVAIGAFAGLLLGLLLVWLQDTYGLIRLEGGLVDFYPVKVQPQDIAAIFILVVLCGMFSSVAPVQIFTRRYSS